MPRPILLSRAYLVTVCMLAFSIPMPFVVSSILLGVVAFLALLSGAVQIKSITNSPPLLLLCVFWLLHALSYFYSADKGESGFDIQSKLSFLVLPLLLGTGWQLDNEKYRWVMLSFIAGVFCAASFAFGQAGFHYLQDGDKSHFFYHELVSGYDANAVYSSWYVFYVLLLLITNATVIASFNTRRWLYILLLVFFAAYFIMLAARMQLVLFLLMLVPLGIAELLRKKRQVLLAACLLAIMAGLSLVLITDNPVKGRFKNLLDTDFSLVNAEAVGDYASKSNNLTLRLFVWKTGVECIRDNQLWWYGAGNGDYHYLMNEQLKKAGVKDMESQESPSHLKNINLHNMYLQTLFMLGVPGLLVLLAIVIMPFLPKYRRQLDVSFLLFVVVAAAMMMPEAALHTYAGIMFFSFFYALHFNPYLRRQLSQ